MSIYEQMIALGYHLLVGQVFGLLFSFLSLCSISFSSFVRCILYTFFSFMMVSIYYFILYQINGGVSHVYLYFSFGISFYMFYHFFYEMLIPIFLEIKRFFRPVKRKMGYAKHRMYGIMKKIKDKGGMIRNEQRKKKSKTKKSDISS